MSGNIIVVSFIYFFSHLIDVLVYKAYCLLSRQEYRRIGKNLLFYDPLPLTSAHVIYECPSQDFSEKKWSFRGDP